MSTEVQSTIAANELATLLIPMNGKQLVLPNVSVAEIIPFVKPTAKEGSPAWFLGYFSWRNTEVPLVSFESLNDESFQSQSVGKRIAVLNGLVDDRLPFCAIVTEGMPRLMRVLPNEVSNDESVTIGPAELARVLVSGEEAVIPNVDFIQQQTLLHI
ncbi:chemotaxis protein CheW [Oceanicoccus sp. KOV_DT_Chl]|uniref:chemotaxis protein CheW n=1 Tax=Oceanicoccus sp. KOV_DT_Chl TaxID=1904639 RepID=UPI000C796E40|nr:chemotaxis protein CheW [Oceanicoccus sp. KOV_DT_Chl]